MSGKNKINPDWKNAPKHNLCARCAGTGVEPDDKAIGGNLKALRIEAGIALRSMARRIRLSHGFLCQLE
ncbi:MAG TPA: hypothetical protein VMQ76_07055, partial [Terracidiphilus sp.]|nr:hypothetical protein [Terracidiphilus sp.]